MKLNLKSFRVRLFIAFPYALLTILANVNVVENNTPFNLFLFYLSLIAFGSIVIYFINYDDKESGS